MSLLVLIPLLPLAAAAACGALALAGARSQRGPATGLVALLAVLGPVGAFIATAMIASRLAGAHGEPMLSQHVVLWEWLAAGDWTLRLGLLADRLSVLMLLFVTGIGALIVLYSVGYMRADRGFARFMAYMNLFLFSMVMLVAGDSLPATFLGWEGVGLCSYLLIGFWHDKAAYCDAARKAFIVNRVGDLGFLLGAFALYQLCGSLEYQAIAAWLRDPANAASLKASEGLAAGAGLLLFLGCCGKSAQMPLHTWLPDAMAGPTPVSALIHAATMVTAGVFLLARLCDLYVAVPDVLAVVTVVGCLTAVWGAVAGLFQHDIKKALAYSTVSQLGFMFMACGMGRFDIALFHVFTHAFFKATLFLGAGGVIHALHHEQDMRRMGGVHQLPGMKWAVYAPMLYAWTAIIGVVFTAGFFSKDLILESLLGSGHVSGQVVGWVALATAGLTAVYMTRVMALTFWSPSRVAEPVRAHVHGIPFTMALPLVILGAGSLVAGYLWFNLGFLGMPGLGCDWFPRWLAPVVGPAQGAMAGGLEHGHHGIAAAVPWIAFPLAAACALGAIIAWRRGPAGGAPAPAVSSDPTGFGATWTWAFDRVQDALVVKPAWAIGLLWYWIVELGLLGLGGHAVAGAVQAMGSGYAALQRSRLRSNLALSAAGLIALLLAVLFGR